MDIDRVRYFHVFAETGSLVRASEILHISQPALSKALKVLEDEVGCDLLEQDGRGLRLTQQGTFFKQATAELLNQWLQIPARTKNTEILKPKRIGSFEVFTTYFLERMTHYVEMTDLELHEYGPGKLEEEIAAEKVDVGITYVPVSKSGLVYTEATKIKMNVFGLKKFRNVHFSELPFVIPLTPHEGVPTKVVGQDGWPEHKYKREVRYRVSMMESALELCRLGLAVAYLPEFVVKLHNQKTLPAFQLVELDSAVSSKDRTQSVYLIHRSTSKEGELHRQIAKALRSL